MQRVMKVWLVGQGRKYQPFYEGPDGFAFSVTGKFMPYAEAVAERDRAAALFASYGAEVKVGESYKEVAG